MTTWTSAKMRINEIPDGCPAGVSDRKNMAEVFDKAEEWGIDPSLAQTASLSNLRRILKVSRHAISNDYQARLIQLFSWAAELNVIDLRLKLGTLDLDTITYQQIIDEGGMFYVMKLMPHQFSRIKRSTKLQHTYVSSD